MEANRRATGTCKVTNTLMPLGVEHNTWFLSSVIASLSCDEYVDAVRR